MRKSWNYRLKLLASLDRKGKAFRKQSGASGRVCALMVETRFTDRRWDVRGVSLEASCGTTCSSLFCSAQIHPRIQTCRQRRFLTNPHRHTRVSPSTTVFFDIAGLYFHLHSRNHTCRWAHTLFPFISFFFPNNKAWVDCDDAKWRLIKFSVDFWTRTGFFNLVTVSPAPALIWW